MILKNIKMNDKSFSEVRKCWGWVQNMRFISLKKKIVVDFEWALALLSSQP